MSDQYFWKPNTPTHKIIFVLWVVIPIFVGISMSGDGAIFNFVIITPVIAVILLPVVYILYWIIKDKD